MVHALAFEPTGQGWSQVVDLLVALVLSSAIGFERELRQKSAGLRTHALVGVGAALFMLVSKYGFTDVVRDGRAVLDPSRVAAQIVSGIGFIGGGLIFVRRDAVRGLTTAAVVWLTAAVGSAAGAGLPVLAVVATLAHFAVVYGYTPLTQRLRGVRRAPSRLRLTYRDGEGILRQALEAITERGFTVAELNVERGRSPLDQRLLDDATYPAEPGLVDVTMDVVGSRSLPAVVAQVGDLPGVVAVTPLDAGTMD